MPGNPRTTALDRLRSDLERKIESSSVDVCRDLREEIARSAAETRRHFDVVMEHVMSRVQLVAEGVAIVDQKVDRLRDEMEQRFEQVDRRLLRLS
jgi:fructose-1-phosphate kinase PfkB-like protein